MQYNRIPLIRSLSSLLLWLGFLVTGSGLSAQEILDVQNPYSSVFVHTGQQSGRFWFAAGAQENFVQYLYRGSRKETSITSNVVFRVDRGGRTSYFCNAPKVIDNGGVRPQGPNGEIPFRPCDTIRRDGNRIEAVWENLDGFTVTMRFTAELPPGGYDDGADILLEFDYRRNVPDTSARLGIFLMLDCDHGELQGGDGASVSASSGYFTSSAMGRLFESGSEAMPEFYHIGNFVYDPESSGTLLPVHRLQGRSLGGAPLTVPDKFAVGSWKVFALFPGISMPTSLPGRSAMLRRRCGGRT